VLIHAVHRPWWNYYYLHLAMPLAWLTGWAASQLIESLIGTQAKGGLTGFKATPRSVALCVLVALALAKSERRFEGTMSYLRTLQLANANPIIQKMREYGGRTSWTYSEDGIYAFHAGLKVIPELAIVMPKRFWSGQITTEAIIGTCKRYRPEMLIVRSNSVDARWRAFLDAEYKLAAGDNASELYVAKQLSDL
jgi:hypothetical protein